MEFIYVVSLVLIGFRFLVRRLDIFTLAFASSAIYFIPAIIPAYPLEPAVYLVFLLVIVFLLLGSLVADHMHRRRRPTAMPDEIALRRYYRGAMALLIPLLIATLMSRASDDVVGKLGEGAGGLAHYGLSVVLGFYFVTAIHLRKKFGVALSLGIYAWIILMGDRTQFVIAVLALLLFISSTKNISLWAFLRRLKPSHRALIVAALLIGLFGKSLYGAYFDSQTGQRFKEAFATRMAQQIESPLSGFEPYHVQSILNLAIRNEDRIPSDYLIWVPVQLLPFAGELGSDVHRQSEAVKALYFSDWSRLSGVSSNFFAEGYLLWGMAGALVFVLIYVAGLIPLALALNSRRWGARLFACFAGAFWAFYIHRSSLFQIVSHEKRIAYAFLGLVVVSAVVTALIRLGPTRRV